MKAYISTLPGKHAKLLGFRSSATDKSPAKLEEFSRAETDRLVFVGKKIIFYPKGRNIYEIKLKNALITFE